MVSINLIITLIKWVLICAVDVEMTHFIFISVTLMVKSDFFTRLWLFGVFSATFMILNSRQFFSVLYVVFLARPSVFSFLSFWFVIIAWRVLLSAFYILLFIIKSTFSFLFSTSFTFASKMNYSIKLIVSSSYLFITLLTFGFLVMLFIFYFMNFQ